MRNRTVETAEGTIAYSVQGAGEAIVLLGGFQGERKNWDRYGYLDLLTDHRVLTVDPLGHGESSKPHDEGAYTAHAVAGHVQAVLDNEQINRAHIWGFSRGGQIAAVCTELIPERCISAIMGGTPLGDSWDTMLPMLLKGEPPLAAGDWDGYWKQFPVPLPQELIEHFITTNDPKALAAIIRSWPKWRTDFANFGLNPGPVPRFAYFGSGEVFADSLREILADSPIESHESDWPGHAETMLDSAGVVAAVKPFLAATRVG